MRQVTFKGMSYSHMPVHFSGAALGVLKLLVGACAASSLLALSANATTVFDKDGTLLDIYGRVQSVFYANDASGVSNDHSSINSSARLGLNLRSQLTNNIAGFATAEWEAANGDNVADEENGFSARYLFVGADFGPYGQLQVGKFEEPIYYATQITDVFEDWGCVGQASNDDRREGLVQYSWSGGGFDVLAGYAFAKDQENVDGAYFIGESANLKYSYSLAAGYTTPEVGIGPISLRAGYLSGEFAQGEQNVWEDTSYDSYNQYALSVSWGSLDLGWYLAAMFQNRSFDVKPLTVDAAARDYDVTGVEVVVGYTFASGVTVLTGYMTQTVDLDQGSKVKAQAVPVYVNYQITPEFNMWAEARFDVGTDDNADHNFDQLIGTDYAQSRFSLGVRYAF